MADITQIKEIVSFYNLFKYNNKHLINNKLKYYKAFFKYKNECYSFLLKHECELTIDFFSNNVFFTIIVDDFKILIEDNGFSIVNIEKNFSINIEEYSSENIYTYNFYFHEEAKYIKIILCEEKIIEFEIGKKIFSLDKINESKNFNNEDIERYYTKILIDFRSSYEDDEENIKIINGSLKINTKNLKIEGLDLLSLVLDIKEDEYKETGNIHLY